MSYLQIRKLPLQLVQESNINSTRIAINHYDNRQPYGYFGRGYRHNKKDKNLTYGVGFIGRKSDKQQVDGMKIISALRRVNTPTIPMINKVVANRT